MIFHNHHRTHRRLAARGFTLVEAVVSVALIGVGVASTLGALTKFNSFAAASRNATGASALLQNQVDLFQSMSPFNPQKTGTGVDLCGGGVPVAQIPKDNCNNPPTYDMTIGTHALGYRDASTTGPVSNEWPVYREPARWTYADAATRTGATGLVMSDLGQLAYQTDTQTYWRLQTTAPTWTQDTSNGLIVKGTMSCTVNNISTASMPNTYNALFTITYTYLNRTYSASMTAIRTSDI